MSIGYQLFKRRNKYGLFKYKSIIISRYSRCLGRFVTNLNQQLWRRDVASVEILDEKTGYIVDCDDIDEMGRQIIRICKENVFSVDDCVAKAKSFDKDLRFKEYIDLLLGEKR